MIATVHCDSCGNDIHDVDPTLYHNKACHKCQEGPLISDADMEVIQNLQTMIDLGLADQNLDDQRKVIHMRFDTSGLRK